MLKSVSSGASRIRQLILLPAVLSTTTLDALKKFELRIGSLDVDTDSPESAG